MRRRHLEQLRPICPACRLAGRGASAVELRAVERESGEHVVDGVLVCVTCEHEYPILDGVPWLLASLREVVSQFLTGFLCRDDLGPLAEGMLADASGPGSWLDVTRQHVSSYAWDHWADLDPHEQAADGGGPVDLGPGGSLAALASPPPGPVPGAARRVLGVGLELAGGGPRGPALDVGCAVGRTSFELAARGEDLVLGVDLNPSFLRVAQAALREGRARYPRRRVGIIHDRREVAVDLPGAKRVDFWACDTSALPFADGAFELVTSLNVVDATASPLGHLGEVGRALRPGGRAVVATPWDWSPSATQVEGWIGGHSPRGALGGASAPFLRQLLTAGAHPQSIAGLSVLGERDDVPWTVRLHDRAVMSYREQVVAVTKA